MTLSLTHGLFRKIVFTFQIFGEFFSDIFPFLTCSCMFCRQKMHFVWFQCLHFIERCFVQYYGTSWGLFLVHLNVCLSGFDDLWVSLGAHWLMRLFKSFISSLMSCLLVHSVPEILPLKSPTIIMHLSISPFSSNSFCVMCFEALFPWGCTFGMLYHPNEKTA